MSRKKQVTILVDGDLKRVADEMFKMSVDNKDNGDFNKAAKLKEKAALLSLLEDEPQEYNAISMQLEQVKKRRLAKAREELAGPGGVPNKGRRTGSNKLKLVSRDHLAEIMQGGGFSKGYVDKISKSAILQLDVQLLKMTEPGSAVRTRNVDKLVEGGKRS